jgi:helix-turn-helix protein
VDSQGKFVKVVAEGHKRNDVRWRSGRLLLSNKRIVLVSNEGKRTIPLAEISTIKGRNDVSQAIAQVSAYLSCQVGSDVTLLAPAQYEAFEAELFGALLDQRPVLVKHPAVKGGVVQDATWGKGRMNVDDEQVNLALSSGTFVEVEVDDVATVETATRTVRGDERPVLDIEHTEEGASVRTYVAGPKQAVSVLGTYLSRGEDVDATDLDLESEELEVVMALYTGVSPFEIPDFVDMDVETVEEVFDELVEEGILERVRTRREVELKARGRSIAGDAMSDQ